MKTLFYKQCVLAAHPMTYAFLLCGGMLLIPSYPYTVAFFYVTLGLFFMYQNAREQRDQDFSALLPIRKRDTVKCAVLFSVTLQGASLLLSAGFAALSQIIAPGRDNPAGIDANPAILGMGLLVYTVFNGIFLPGFYRTGYKVGVSFLKASAGVLLVAACDVLLPHLVPWLDGTDSRQYLMLAGCAALYTAVTLVSYRVSAARYEKLDL